MGKLLNDKLAELSSNRRMIIEDRAKQLINGNDFTRSEDCS